jgi:hypothetical protein
MQSLKNYFRPLDMATESERKSAQPTTKSSQPVSDFIDLTSDDSFENQPSSTPIVARPSKILAMRENVTNTTSAVNKPTKTLGVKLGSSVNYLPFGLTSTTNSGQTAKKSFERDALVPLGRADTASSAKVHGLVPLGKQVTAVKNDSDESSQREKARLAEEILNLKERMRQTSVRKNGQYSHLNKCI